MRRSNRFAVWVVLALLLASSMSGLFGNPVVASPAKSTQSIETGGADKDCESGGICFLDPEPAPPGVDPSVPVEPEFGTSAEDGYAECDGDGESGKRVQMMYFYGAGQPDRFAEFSDSLRIWATNMDDVYQNSAAKTGGNRYVRFVHGADCKISVKKYEIPAEYANDTSIFDIYYHLMDTAHFSNDRKIVAFMDVSSAFYCGVGTHYVDDSAGANNLHNLYFGLALVYNGCWNNGRTLAHELGHMLGAVQESAPHYSEADGHCTDNWDVMCYFSQPVVAGCTDTINKLLLDCNNDDYFHTNPPSGSYLATNWNVANSVFLGKPIPTMKLDKSSSKYNGWVTVSLSNFNPNVNVNVKWPGNVLLASVKAGSDGKATTRFRTPMVPLGNYQVRASNSQGQASTATLRVIPRINLNEFSGETGDQIRVYYYGFSPGETVEVRFYNEAGTTFQVVATVTIADTGRGSKVFTVPTNTTIGKHKIVGKVIGVSRSASTTFSVTGLGGAEEPTATVTPEPTETSTPELTPTAELTPTVEAPTEEPTSEIPTEEPTFEAPTEEPTIEVPIETPTIVVPAETPAPIEPVASETPEPVDLSRGDWFA